MRTRTVAQIALLSSLGATGCDSSAASKVTVEVGHGGAKSFAPRSAYAEYLELVGDRNELVITLADHESSCEAYTPPERDQTAISVTLVTPPKEQPAAGTYPWDGTHAFEGPATTALAIPKVLIGPKSYLFQAGGSVKVTDIDLAPHGTVSGLLALSFPGDAAHPATRIEGSFAANICRFNAAPTR